MEDKVPTLSGAGFLAAPDQKAEKILSYFIVSQYSQSRLFRGEVASLPYLIQKYSNRPSALSDAVQNALNNLYRRYFADARVEVSVNPIPDDPARLDISISVTVTAGGKNYSLGRMIQVSNSIVSQVVDLNRE